MRCKCLSDFSDLLRVSLDCDERDVRDKKNRISSYRRDAASVADVACETMIAVTWHV